MFHLLERTPVPRGNYMNVGETLFSPGRAETLTVSVGSNFIFCRGGKKDAVPSVLWVTRLSAGYRTNRCVPLHENVFDELRSPRYQVTRSA